MAKLTRKQLVRKLRASQKTVKQLLASMAHVQDWQPEPAEWSFRYSAAHLVAIERDHYFPRIRRIASGEHPHFDYYTDTYFNLGETDLLESLREWQTIRQELLAFVQTLPEDKLYLTGVHETLGSITVLDTLEDLLKSDLGQVQHLQNLIEDFYETETGAPHSRGMVK